MNPRTAGALILAALAGGVAFGPLGAAPDKVPANLCEIDEQPVFACKAGRSLASICVGREHATYRYGLPGSPSLAVTSTADWSNVHRGGVVGQGGGHQTHVRFTTGLIHYTVYAGLNGRLTDDPGRSYAGIDVSQGKGGETAIAAIPCDAGFWTSADWTEHLRAAAPLRFRDALDETTDGPFDGWF